MVGDTRRADLSSYGGGRQSRLFSSWTWTRFEEGWMEKDVEERFEMLRVGIAEQFERQAADAHHRHEALLELLGLKFDAIDRRFEAVDMRFGEERATTAGQFELMQKRMDARFDALITTWLQTHHKLDRRVRKLEDN